MHLSSRLCDFLILVEWGAVRQIRQEEIVLAGDVLGLDANSENCCKEFRLVAMPDLKNLFRPEGELFETRVKNNWKVARSDRFTRAKPYIHNDMHSYV